MVSALLSSPTRLQRGGRLCFRVLYAPAGWSLPPGRSPQRWVRDYARVNLRLFLRAFISFSGPVQRTPTWAIGMRSCENYHAVSRNGWTDYPPRGFVARISYSVASVQR